LVSSLPLLHKYLKTITSMKTYRQFTFEMYDRSTGRPHRGSDYKGRDYGGGPDDKPTVKIPLSGVMQGGFLKREKEEKKK